MADIEEIEIYGPGGKRLSGGSLWMACTAPMPRKMSGPAMIATPGDARVVSEFILPEIGDELPLLTQNRYGAGTAPWVAVGVKSCMTEAALTCA